MTLNYDEREALFRTQRLVQDIHKTTTKTDPVLRKLVEHYNEHALLVHSITHSSFDEMSYQPELANRACRIAEYLVKEIGLRQ